MRAKLLAGVALALLLPGSVHAQNVFITAIVKGGGGGPPPGYIGVGDEKASALVYYGLRAYSAAYAAAQGNAVELCLPSAGACTNIRVATTGGLDTSDLTTSGCSAITTCTVKTLYDQSGNSCNAAQNTEADRPFFYPSGVSSGKPSIYFTGAGAPRFLRATCIPTTAVPWTFGVVAAIDTYGGGNQRIWTAAEPVGILISSGPQFSMYAGSVAAASGSITLNTHYAVIARTDGTGSGGVVSVSGSATSGLNPGNASVGQPGELGLYYSSTFNGEISEAVLWGSNLSGGETTAVNNNMQTFWGI